MLHFTLWDVILIYLVLAAVPLGIVCAICGVWYYFSRSRFALIAAIVVGVPFVVGASVGIAGFVSNWNDVRISRADAQAHTRTLTKSEIVKGARLPAGTVVYDDGYNPGVSVTLKSTTTIHRVPVRGVVSYAEDGIDGNVTIAQDATIAGVPCKAGDGKFRHGRLDTCVLARPATIRGVPCRGYVMLIDGDASDLACTIARPFRLNGVRLPGGDDIEFGTYTIDRQTTSVRLFGKSLARKSRIVFEKSGVTLYLSGDIVAGSCGYDVISREASTWTGIGYDTGRQKRCRVKLPAGAVTL